ncbi:hypothetical protein TNCV_3568761 [Trichonephila clavipes]|nr:hypothetical protein TNCV_3568761 [Trichonephila clavipes]
MIITLLIPINTASPGTFPLIIHCSDLLKKSLLDSREADPLELSFLDIQKAFDRVWGRFLDLPFDLYQRISATNREPTFTVPPTNHNSAIQTTQDFTAETVCKKISDSVATPPCHVRPTNQDTHSQAGPPT